MEMHIGLYRGRQKGTKDWVEGYYVVIDDIHYIFTGKFEKIEVEPETVDAYTFLNDRNNNKIFAGDIIMAGIQPCVVKYEVKNARYMLYVLGITPVNGFNYDTMQMKTVVGNIHDNPELLQQSSNI